MRFICFVTIYIFSCCVAWSQIADSYSKYAELLEVEENQGVIITHENTKEILIVHLNESRIKFLLARSTPQYTMEQVVATGQLNSPKFCSDVLRILNKKNEVFVEFSEKDSEIFNAVTGGGSLSILTKDNKITVSNVIYLYRLQKENEISLEGNLKPYVQLSLIMARLFPPFMNEFYGADLLTDLSEETRLEDLSFSPPKKTKN